MNALPCHVPVKSEVPLGYLVPEGFVVFDDVVAILLWAVVCAKAANDTHERKAA